MATGTVGATVDATTKAIAAAYIRKAGTTPNQIIRSLWEHIAATGEIPSYDDQAVSERERRREAFDRMQRIVDSMPKGTPLATMTDDDLRRELEKRDV